MRYRKSSGSFRWPCGALLAFAIAVSMVPAKAEAGCEHPLVTRTDRDAIGRMRESLSVGQPGIDLATSTPLPGVPARGPRPCNGPSCSGDPAAPSGPPIAVSLARYVGTWACLDESAPPDAPRSYPLVPGGSDLRPAGRGLAIFHPPRHPFATLRTEA